MCRQKLKQHYLHDDPPTELGAKAFPSSPDTNCD
jgi:hypothetical protein